MCRYTTLWNIRWCTQASNTTDQLHDQRWSSLACGPKQLALKSDRLCCLECSLTVNQLKQAIVAEWGKLSQRVVNCAIGQWRRRLVCVVQQQGGHIMTLDNNWNNKHVSVVNFSKCLVFDCYSKDTDISQGSVATHLKCGGIYSDSFITDCLLILTVKNSENRLIFG